MIAGVPDWIAHLIVGIFIFCLVSCSGIILTRTGRNPYYALLLLIPVVQVIAIWMFAYSMWPGVKKNQ